MVRQRVVGFQEMGSAYTHALDDDVEFTSDFVKSLIEVVDRYNADFVNPVILDIANHNYMIDNTLSPLHNSIKYQLAT